MDTNGCPLLTKFVSAPCDHDMPPGGVESLRIFLLQRLFNFLVGISLGDWLKLLKANHFAIDPSFWPRATLITFGSALNSIVRWREERRHGVEVAAQRLESPIFILGHWRSGTTLLHNLFAVDQNVACPNNYQTTYPHTFLVSEAASGTSDRLLPKRRLQDNVRLGMREPQEDEFALCVATFLSPYMGWVFPRHREVYQRYLTFRDVVPEDVARWKGAFIYYLKKLAFKYHRPLVLKSPPHTCRIRLLLEMFPDARFVHIHRDPFAVFQSTRRLFQTAVAAMRLHACDQEDLDAQIIENYRVMYQAFFEERDLIPAGQFCEVAFENLERDPAGQIRLIYDQLGLSRSEQLDVSIDRYVESLADYRKNAYSELSDGFRARLATAWQPSFTEWGYPLE